MTAKIVDGVLRAVRELEPGGRWGDLERAVWDALDAAVATERERCAKVCELMADEPDASSERYESGCAARIRGA